MKLVKARVRKTLPPRYHIISCPADCRFQRASCTEEMNPWPPPPPPPTGLPEDVDVLYIPVAFRMWNAFCTSPPQWVRRTKRCRAEGDGVTESVTPVLNSPFHLDFRAHAMDWRLKSAGSRGEHVSGVAGRAHSCISLVLVVVKTSHFTATRWEQKITAV